MKTNTSKLQYRPLKTFYTDRTLTYEGLLEKKSSVSIYQRSFWVSATKIYELYAEVAPSIINEIFRKRKMRYKTRNILVLQQKISELYTMVQKH